MAAVQRPSPTAVRALSYDWQVELRRLRYFVAVADELHFTRAADRLRVAQPALSVQIRELERELGVTLLVRTKRSVALTEVGRLFLDHARRVLDEAALAERVARRAGRGEIGRLVVGFVPPAAGDLLPKAVRAYRFGHPDVEVILQEMTSAAQIDGLLAGTMQVGLVHRVAPHDKIELKVVRQERIVVAMPADHPRAGDLSVSLRDLADDRWVVGPQFAPDSSGFLIEACARLGFAPKIAQAPTDNSTRLLLVAAGIGLALIAASVPELQRPDLIYVPIREPRIEVPLQLAWRRDRISPLVDRFLATILT
jgi:DNA-binding transcriptional LysR family regulator